MAEESKGKTEKRITEIDEVQEFGGGEVKSVEPLAEVTEHFHEYSGGEIIERANTTISPILWGVWSIIILGIIITLVVTGAIPGIHMAGGGYARPSYTNNVGYNKLQAKMASDVTIIRESNTLDMYKLQLPAGQNLTQAITAGTDVYQTYCIGCHGPNQDGNGPNALSLDPKPRNLRDGPFVEGLSYERIWTSVHKGVPGTAMPRWENTLSDDQIRDVISYVFSLTAPVDNQGNFLPPPPGVTAGTAPAAATTSGP